MFKKYRQYAGATMAVMFLLAAAMPAAAHHAQSGSAWDNRLPDLKSAAAADKIMMTETAENNAQLFESLYALQYPLFDGDEAVFRSDIFYMPIGDRRFVPYYLDAARGWTNLLLRQRVTPTIQLAMNNGNAQWRDNGYLDGGQTDMPESVLDAGTFAPTMGIAPFSAPSDPVPGSTWDFTSVPDDGGGTGGSGADYTGTWTWVRDTKTLTLTNFHFTTTASRALLMPVGSTITLVGDNTITSEGGSWSYGIECGELIINGSGKLTVTAGDTTGTFISYGIFSSVALTIDGATVIAQTGTATNGGNVGIPAGAVKITGGANVTAIGGDAKFGSIGIEAMELSIEGGTVTATGGTGGTNHGIVVVKSMTITGGTVTAIGNNGAISFPIGNYTVPVGFKATTFADVTGTGVETIILEGGEIKAEHKWVKIEALPTAPPSPPTGVSATAGNGYATVSFTGSAGANHYTVTASPGPQTQSGMSSPINVTGLTNGTSYTFTVTATNDFGPSAPSAPSNAVIPTAPSSPTAPTITTTVLPNGKDGEAYSQVLAATGDTPITWSITDGALPDGLTLSATGVISGTPAKAGTFNFTVRATNGVGDNTKALSIFISNFGDVPGTGIPDIAGMTAAMIALFAVSAALWVHVGYAYIPRRKQLSGFLSGLLKREIEVI